MKSKVFSSLSLLVGLCLILGSCLDDGTITPYQRQQEDIKKIDTYLSDNPPEVTDIIIRDAFSGIRMVITQPGTGEIPPTPENIIQVSYVGRVLKNGQLSDPFDQNDSFTFTLTNADTGPDVIAGWKFALAMMTLGTHATVYIPSGQAYGPSGSGPIPANAILVFEMELKVVNTENEEPRLTNDKQDIALYLDENSIENVQEDPSGLFYTVENIGTGDAPGLYDHVRMIYSGKTLHLPQIEFADNVESGPNNLFSSRVVNYIHGLTIGLQKLNAGGKATFYIPSALAYGPSVNGNIPANSILIFEVELLEVTPNME